MTELKKLARAKMYMENLANGINPLDGSLIPEDEIVNNVHVSRCLFYVSDVLNRVIEEQTEKEQEPINTPERKNTRRNKKPFSLTAEEKSKLQPTRTPLSISQLVKCLNSMIDTETTRKIAVEDISGWLLNIELLERVTLDNGKYQRVATEKGKEFGLYNEERIGQHGKYTIVLYSFEAQQFIYDNIDVIIAPQNGKDDPLWEFHWRPWTEDHDKRLAFLHGNCISVSEIARELRRPVQGVESRLKALGLK